MNALMAERLRPHVRSGLLTRVLLLVGIYVFLAATTVGFGTVDNIYSALDSAALVGLVAAGVSVTMLAGELDLSVASVATCGGIIAIQMIDHGIVVAVVAATVCGMAFGLVQGFLIAKLRINSLVFTIGTLIAMRGVGYKLSNEMPVSLPIAQLDISTSISQRLGVFSPFSLVMLFSFAVLGFLLAYTKSGRELYAFGGGREESKAAGISQTRPVVLAFTASASLAGLAGALSCLRSGSANPVSNSDLLVSAVTAALIGGVSLYGGRGTAAGVFLGVMTLQFLLSGLALQGAPSWASNVASGCLLLGFLVIDLFSEHSALVQTLSRWRAGLQPQATPSDRKVVS